jgi:nucleotide-binding universal stress UspA family protein
MAKLVVAVDNSQNSLQALDYIAMMLSSRLDLVLELLYIVPGLPPLFDDPVVRRESKKQIEALEKRNNELADTVLSDATDRLVSKGFPKNNIHTKAEPKKQGPARDICQYAGMHKARAIVLGARGRSRLEKFFTGSVSSHIIENCKAIPIVQVNSQVESKKVLMAIDASDNAMCAVDTAAEMLAGTDAEITLIHTKQDLCSYLPDEVVSAAPEMQDIWQTKLEQQIAPFMQNARDRLTNAGVNEKNIVSKIIAGTRNPADDILNYARKNGFGSIVMGRHGSSNQQEYALGGVSGKVLQASANMAVWFC